jgi:hypothetical protein
MLAICHWRGGLAGPCCAGNQPTSQAAEATAVPAQESDSTRDVMLAIGHWRGGIGLPAGACNAGYFPTSKYVAAAAAGPVQARVAV